MCTGLIGHCFLIFGATGRLALYVYGADWALFLIFGATGRLALYVYGADWALFIL